MYIVLSGRLSVYRTGEDATDEIKGKIHPGEPTGEIQFLTGGMHTASIRAETDAELVKIPRTVIERLTESDGETLKHLAEFIHRRLQRYRLYDILPRLFGKLDDKIVTNIEENIEWKRLGGGELLFRQGDLWR